VSYFKEIIDNKEITQMRDEENESMEKGTKNRALIYARHRNIVLLMNLEKLNSLRKYFG
jgi:hypothetical protein